jgi:hypothetical protein
MEDLADGQSRSDPEGLVRNGEDSKNSHPGSSLWGDGWGWSWFDAGNPMKTTSTSYKKDCLSCHVPAQATDWIYTAGYPALK